MTNVQQKVVIFIELLADEVVLIERYPLKTQCFGQASAAVFFLGQLFFASAGCFLFLSVHLMMDILKEALSHLRDLRVDERPGERSASVLPFL